MTLFAQLQIRGEGGAAVSGTVVGRNSTLFLWFSPTYRSFFPRVAVGPFPLSGAADSLRNIIVVAANAALPSVDVLRERWAGVRADHPQAPELDHVWSSNWTRFVPTRDVPVLTDDYAPTDALILVD